MSHRGMFRALLAASLAFATSAMPSRASADELLVFAAASLKPALDEIIATPDAKAIGEIKTSYAASSQLAKQIEAGAPAALFISADQDWMNEAASKQKIVAATRVDLLGNALVLVAPKDS
ncbi:MAG: molybdate ABC transporter substrate-binding protein, partial [Rhodanobacteraceae bacterium]